MRNIKTIILLLLALTTIFNSCKRQDANLVTVAAGFTDEVKQAQNLVFLFSRDVYEGGEEGTWISKEYVEFKPAVKGKFQWKSKRELVFSPDNGFSPSTRYEATVQKTALETAKQKTLHLDNKTSKYKFSTALLRAENMDLYWGQDAQGRIGLISKISFNYDIQVAPMANQVDFLTNDKKAQATFNDNRDVAKEISYTLPVEVQQSEDVVVKATVKKGVLLSTGKYTTSKEVLLTGNIAARNRLEILEITTQAHPQNGEIRIKTSQQVDAASLENAITLNPVVDFKTEVKENYIILKGQFFENINYNITISSSLKGIAGGTMSQDYSSELGFKPPTPEISFSNSKGMYLSSAGFKNIALNILNVKKVNVKVYKVYENNILPYSRQGGYYYYDEYDYGSEYMEDESGFYSDVVMDRQINTSDLPDVDGYKLLHLDIPAGNSLKGVYFVRVSSSDDYYIRATKLVSISDIGLIVKEGRNSLMVYANSILNAAPIGNLEINVVSTNNQLITTTKTNAKGIAIVKDLENIKGDFIPHMITAKSGNDFNFLLFSKAFVESSRFEVDGARNNKAGVDAYIYGDRNLYRPGDTIHVNTILRDLKKKPIAGQPVKMKVLQPSGMELVVVRKETDKQGGVALDVPVALGAVTGYYTIEVYNGSDVLLNSRSINVEEFMPDRIGVKLSTNKPLYQLKDKVHIEIAAQNYFGPPASNRNAELELTFTRKYFSPKGFEKFTFNNNNNTRVTSVVQSFTTNEAGVVSWDYEIPESYMDMGMLQANIYATVFDETGRPVNRIANFDVATQPVMYGIYSEDYYTGTNKNSAIEFAALSAEGKPLTAAAEVEIVRFDWQNSLYRYSRRYGYNATRIEKQVLKKEITVSNGKYTLQFSAPVSGEYEIRIRRPGSNFYTPYRIYAYTWGSTTASSFNINTEGTVDITFDKEKYKVGESAKVLFKAPFNGKILVTLERDDIIEHYELQTKDRTAELKLKLGREHLPNVYVAATLIKPLENSDIPLMVAHGYNSLSVEDEKTRLPLQIIAPEKMRSAVKQKIKVKTAGANTPVTIAIVDEGILALKNFQTPDPHGFFYAKRALEVNSYDVYPYLFPELGSKSSSGGDAYAMALDKRVNPLANPRVKLLSFWSGVLKTDAKGEATFEISVPKFSGQLRIMAVAYKDEAFASAEKSLTVADPLVVVTALPRFLSPGDEIEMPVNISNTTDKNAQVQTTVKVEGPVTLTGAAQSFAVNAKREGLASFRLAAQGKIGIAKIKVEVKGLGETFTDITEITVRPASSLVKVSGSSGIGNGESAELDFNGDWLAGTDEHKLVVSRNPLHGFSYKLGELLGYPHGCLEQTVSKAFPQLYFADFIKTMYNAKSPYNYTGENELNPEFNVKEAIDKVQRLQYYNGSFSYWPGGEYFNNWSTVYATNFLVEAEKAGFNVDQQVKDNALNFLESITNYRKTENYYYYDETNNRITFKVIPAREDIYALYVLALAGKPNRSSMNYYKSETGQLTIDQLYLLAAAYKLAGDQRAAKDLIPKALSTENAVRSTGGSFYSNIRNLAVSLNALLETDPAHPQVLPLTQSLCRYLAAERYWSTQEQAFSFLALGKLSKIGAKSNAVVKVMVDGRVYKTTNGNEALTLSTKELRGKKITLQGEGNGMAFYSWNSEGISLGGIKEEDNLIQVRKTFYDRFGKQITGNTFKQNDLVVVKLTVNSLDGSYLENIVVTDMLPAGFEIDNPRITEGREYTWFTNRLWPQHYDIRDDRINYFTSVSAQPQSLYYLVRVVNKGTFNMGPASADAMYNGDYHSYSGAGKVKVE